MQTRTLILLLAICILSLPASFALAADQVAPKEGIQDTTHEHEHVQAQGKDQEQIYGSQLMTQQERDEYRARMHAAESKEEQERIRKEHHEFMQERAKERGMNLPDMMPMHRDDNGMGSGGMGGGIGGGMGGGGGMGSGGGMGGGHR